MISIYGIYNQLAYIIYYLYHILEKINNKYINGNSVVILYTFCKQYDSIHNLHIMSCIFNIKIFTFTSDKYIKYIIYTDKSKISEITFINNKIVNNNKIEIIRTIIFIDELNLINTLVFYNCGVIIHQNDHINHIYNYMGHRRNIEKIYDFEYIDNIKYN
jgi:hypothetical protein